MYRPVLVAPAAELPVTLEEMKQALRIIERDGNGDVLPHEDDALIGDEIKSAVAHYEGWTGILGIVLSEQVWRQDYDRFSRSLSLPLGPVLEIIAVRWRDKEGAVSTVDPSDYALITDAGGRSSVRFRGGFVFPATLHEQGGVQIEYRAGWPFPGVPDDIKAAIKIRVQIAYDEAARDASVHLARIESELVAKWRRFLL